MLVLLLIFRQVNLLYSRRLLDVLFCWCEKRDWILRPRLFSVASLRSYELLTPSGFVSSVRLALGRNCVAQKGRIYRSPFGRAFPRSEIHYQPFKPLMIYKKPTQKGTLGVPAIKQVLKSTTIPPRAIKLSAVLVLLVNTHPTTFCTNTIFGRC